MINFFCVLIIYCIIYSSLVRYAKFHLPGRRFYVSNSLFPGIEDKMINKIKDYDHEVDFRTGDLDEISSDEISANSDEEDEESSGN